MNWIKAVNNKENNISKKISSNNLNNSIIEDNNDNDQYEILFNNYSKDNIIYKDVDDEYDFKYMRKISYLKEEFKELINFHSLPFLDKEHINYDYNFNDYIKENCENFIKVEKEVNNYNKEINNEIEEENKKKYEEYKEEYDYYNS